jgi:hypothetical protein
MHHPTGTNTLTLSHTVDLQETLQKRLVKAKLATESAHESERRALSTLEVERADLEAQRDAVKQELWASQADAASLRADLESEQKKAKKLKKKVRETGEVRWAGFVSVPSCYPPRVNSMRGGFGCVW